MCSFWNVLFFGTCLFWNVFLLQCFLSGMCCLGYIPFWEYALFGLCPLVTEQCAFFGMCSFWNVPYLAGALSAKCSFWNIPFLVDCLLWNVPFLNVLFWECALLGLCLFWTVKCRQNCNLQLHHPLSQQCSMPNIVVDQCFAHSELYCTPYN